MLAEKRNDSVQTDVEISGGMPIRIRSIRKRFILLYANSVVRSSQLTVAALESSAVRIATIKPGLGVWQVSNINFHDEKMYAATMMIARKLLEKGGISKDDFWQINTIFQKKYKPILGSLQYINELQSSQS